MHLIQLLVPVLDSGGQAFPDAVMAELRHALVGRFGGLTAFTRAPAEGIWSQGDGLVLDKIIILEVMAKELDQAWWRQFRDTWEEKLGQEDLVIRSHVFQRL